MTGRKLVSVVTGTWQRHELLLEAIENVRAQTYRPLEHIIVSDGPDARLRDLVDEASPIPDIPVTRDTNCYLYGQPEYELSPNAVPIRYAECGRNWTTYLANSRNAAPIMVAQLMARGEYITWLADDERMQPDHIESLVDLLEAEGADFVYSQTDCYWVGRPERRWVIGTDPPQCGQITNVLYRAKLLEKGLTRLGADPCPDWDQIGAWVAAGAKWAYLPRVTFEHRADH